MEQSDIIECLLIQLQKLTEKIKAIEKRIENLNRKISYNARHNTI